MVVVESDEEPIVRCKSAALRESKEGAEDREPRTYQLHHLVIVVIVDLLLLSFSLSVALPRRPCTFTFSAIFCLFLGPLLSRRWCLLPGRSIQRVSPVVFVGLRLFILFLPFAFRLQPNFFEADALFGARKICYSSSTPVGRCVCLGKKQKSFGVLRGPTFAISKH